MLTSGMPEHMVRKSQVIDHQIIYGLKDMYIFKFLSQMLESILHFFIRYFLKGYR